jgi:hypothetical protein
MGGQRADRVCVCVLGYAFASTGKENPGEEMVKNIP